MPSLNKDRSTAALCVVVSMFCYAVVPIFLRYFRRVGLDPWTVNGLRYAVAALFWLPFVVGSMRRLGRPGNEASDHHRNVWRDALVPTAINLLGQIGWGICPYFAENDAATIAFTIRTSFLFTMLFGFALIPSERPLLKRPLFLIGAAVCVGGVVLMFVQKLNVSGSWHGMAFLLATALVWGGYAVSVRRCMSGYPIRLAFGVVSLYTACGLLVGMLINVGWMSARGQRWALPAQGPGVWALLILSAFIGIAFGHVLYYRGIHRLGPIISSGILLAGPFVTFVGSWLVLGETITALQLAGGVSVILGGACLLMSKAQIEAAD